MMDSKLEKAPGSSGTGTVTPSSQRRNDRMPRLPEGVKAHGLQVVERKSNNAKRVRPHTVPGTLMPEVRAGLALEMAAGRNSAQTAKDSNASQFVAIELWVRYEIRKLREQIAYKAAA